MSKIKFIVLAVLLLITAGTVIYIFRSNNSDLEVSVVTPPEAQLGVPFEMKVEFSNRSGQVLNNVALTLTLPDGAVFVGSSADRLIDNRDLGNVGENSLMSQTYKVMFLQGRDSTKKIRAHIAYSPDTLGARFELEKSADINVRDSGMTIELKAPEKVFSGEEFDLNVKYKNISSSDLNDLTLTMEYPPSFTFIKSTLKPDTDKTTWILGDLHSDSEGEFTLTGSVAGPDNSALTFNAGVTMTVGGREYKLEPTPLNMTITPSPLTLTVKANEDQNYIAKPGDDLQYVVSYVNTTDIALREVVIRAQLVGEMFDLNQVETRGVYRFSDNTLIWNSQLIPELSYVGPHSAGFVNFKVHIKDTYPIRRFGDKNFTLRVNTEIESPTVPNYVTASKTFNIAKLETKVAGNITIQAKGYFRDANSGILNKGVMPPRVNQPTQFTIHWLLQNFANDAATIEIRATLGDGVTFAGNAQSNFGPAPTYDSGAKQVIWLIDALAANKGVSDQPLEAVFQIEAKPSASNIGSYMTLISDTSVRAKDGFTGLDLSATASPVTTALPDDSTVGAQGGVVQP